MASLSLPVAVFCATVSQVRTTAWGRRPRSSSATAGAISPRDQTAQYRSCPACGLGISSSTPPRGRPHSLCSGQGRR
eukprot:4995891-Lingulodinium_polyedra.AAC.1